MTSSPPSSSPPPSQPWRMLSAGGDSTGYIHHDYVPVHLFQAVRHPPRRVLDVGCFAGATGAFLKSRYPDAWVAGVEPRADAAVLAARRLDEVQAATLEGFDFARAGIAPASLDTVILADVLEHMYDPWAALLALRPWLTSDAQLLVSLPNVRNLWLMDRMAAGEWTYEAQGLLDITHIRFFTRRGAVALFHETGYRTDQIHCHIDERCRSILSLPMTGPTLDVSTSRLTLRGLNREDVAELATLQFYFAATPGP